MKDQPGCLHVFSSWYIVLYCHSFSSGSSTVSCYCSAGLCQHAGSLLCSKAVRQPLLWHYYPKLLSAGLQVKDSTFTFALSYSHILILISCPDMIAVFFSKKKVSYWQNPDASLPPILFKSDQCYMYYCLWWMDGCPKEMKSHSFGNKKCIFYIHNNAMLIGAHWRWLLWTALENVRLHKLHILNKYEMTVSSVFKKESVSLYEN